jgi:hypothetical protein
MVAMDDADGCDDVDYIRRYAGSCQSERAAFCQLIERFIIE